MNTKENKAVLVLDLPAETLERAASIKRQMEQLGNQLTDVLGGVRSTIVPQSPQSTKPKATRKPRKPLNEEAKARMKEAQQKRRQREKGEKEAKNKPQESQQQKAA